MRIFSLEGSKIENRFFFIVFPVKLDDVYIHSHYILYNLNRITKIAAKVIGKYEKS